MFHTRASRLWLPPNNVGARRGPGRQKNIQIDAEFDSESNAATPVSQLVLEVEILQFLYYRFLDLAKFSQVI